MVSTAVLQDIAGISAEVRLPVTQRTNTRHTQQDCCSPEQARSIREHTATQIERNWLC